MKLARLGIFSLLLSAVISACAASSRETGDETNGDEGSGASSGSASGGAGGSTGTQGSGGSIPMGPCLKAADCAYMNDVCNTGACINGTCQKSPANDYAACDDGLFCTENDTCLNGACVAGTLKFCASLDECHLGICDEDLKTCKNIPGNDGAQCDDKDECTYIGQCSTGVCSKGQQIDCSAYNSQCAVGVCDPLVGCKAMPTNDGTACNDNQYCTINDACSNGTCLGQPNTCTAPGDVCMIGTCDEGLDKCIAVPGNNGANCNDGNDCTAGETCSNGLCVGGMPANNGMACDDKNGCTSGTSCANGNCTNPMSEIVQCVGGDMCCPAGCGGNDNDCLYWASGVQQNVPQNMLTGWSQCYSGTYIDFADLNTVLNQCDKSKLLLACRPVGNASYTLLAMAPRVDVLFNCGQQQDCTQQSNGVGWYYSTDWSWGFAPGGLSVNRFSCDYNDGSQQSPELRMCWHTGGNGISSGYRCGSNDLNGGSTWERVIFEAD